MKRLVVVMAVVLTSMIGVNLSVSFASEKGIVESFSEEDLRQLWELFEKFSEEKLQNEIKEVSATLDKIEGMKDDGDDEWKGLLL